MVGGGATVFRWSEKKPIDSVLRFAARDFDLFKSTMKNSDKTYRIDNSIQPASLTGQPLFKSTHGSRRMIVLKNNNTLSTHAYHQAPGRFRDAGLVTAINVNIGSKK